MKHFTTTVVNGNSIHLIGTDNEKLRMTTRSFAFSGGCYFNGVGGGIEIGEGTIFSFNVVVISAEHDFQDYRITTKKEKVKIGKDCWIGANSTILAEVEIAEGCVVGVGSVVNRSVSEKNKIIAGVPAKAIKDKFE